MASFKTLALAFGLAAGALAVGGRYVYDMAYDYSDGTRTGEVFKLSHKGALCKTWEGQMMTDGYGRVEGQGNTASFEFTVLNKSLVDKIQNAADTGAHVDLQYRQVKWRVPCVQESEYVATAINTINASGQKTPYVIVAPSSSRR